MLQQTQAPRVVGPVPGVHGAVPRPRRRAPPPARRRWCGPGRASATTAGPSTSTAPRWRSSSGTAAGCPPTWTRSGRSPGSAPTPPGRCWPSPSRRTSAWWTPTWRGCWPGRWPGAPLRPAEAQALADRLVPPGRAVGVQPGALRPRGRGTARLAPPGLRRLPAGADAAPGRRPAARCRTRPRARRARRAASRRSTAPTARAGAAWWRPCGRARCPVGTWPRPPGGPRSPARARRVAEGLVAEGFATWSGGSLVLG